jgi:hypothetical protein
VNNVTPKRDGFISSSRPEHPRFTGCDEIEQSPIRLGRPITSAAPNSHQMFAVAQSSVAKYMVKAKWAAKPGMVHFTCITTRRTLPPWICSSSRPLASNCFMPSSSFG